MYMMCRKFNKNKILNFICHDKYINLKFQKFRGEATPNFFHIIYENDMKSEYE
jgi:hypothetical protein